jgi:tetratricopeptide (TPR) repeat protein
MPSAGSDGDGPRWRVFISHTSELRDFPKPRSYVHEVERAITAAGHVIVDMTDFPAADQQPARLCVDRVRACDVYVGVLGTRYGSPVRDRPDVSYTELEFDTATQKGVDRLMFTLDINAEGAGIPASALIDREFGARQDAFLHRVRDSGLTQKSFANPARLGQLVERSLRELAETGRRIASGIQREQVPAEPQPVRTSKFVNRPPAVAPTWFQGRQVETGLLARYVTDPGIRLVTVVGRGGIGKTAMVCRLLKGVEAGHVPDVTGDHAEITVGGIIYLGRNGMHNVQYPTLVEDLLRLLPADAAQRLHRMYQDPHHTPREMMLALLEAFPVDQPMVVLLDNLESVMDTECETLAEPALQEALGTVLTAPTHPITVIATTRVLPTALVKVEPASQRQLRMEQGLGSPDAEIVLRELDDDGHLGLRDAADELLDGLRRHTRGFPRALEAVKAILDGDSTLTPQDLFDRTRHLPEDQVVQVLVGEAYELLDEPAQQVMQALSVYPAPVSAVGVDFVLRPVNPTTDAGPILTRLVRRQLVRFQDGRYFLHPLDADYARSQLPLGSPGDSPTAFTLIGLQARAADYYAQIRTPRASRRSLDDVRPQLAEFELRCDAGDYDTAATVLNDIDFHYLQRWGHYRMLVDLRARLHGRSTDRYLNSFHLSSLGSCHLSLGDYRQAIDLYTQALAIDREIGDRQGEGADLTGLGSCHLSLGDYRQAIDLYTQALAIAREIGDRQGEGADLTGLGSCHLSLGDYRQAIDLYTQALAIDREIGDRQGEGVDLGNLGSCQRSLGDYRRAIDLHTQALAIAREIGDRRGEGADLGSLGSCHHSLGDYRWAIDLYTQALAIAREIGDRQGEGADLGNLGSCQRSLGDYRRAIDLHTQALAIAREIGDRGREGLRLGSLGSCHHSLGDYRRAIDLYTQALAIAREIGDRYTEANTLDYLGRSWLAAGDAPQAITLLDQAVWLADNTGDRQPAVHARSGLAQAHLQAGDPAAALAATATARELPYPTEEPTLWLLEGLALLDLHRVEEAAPALWNALNAADALLTVTDSNVAALHARALALSGLAALNADPNRAKEAVAALARAHTITRAPGVVADTQRLLQLIASHDAAGIFAELHTAAGGHSPIPN